MNNNLALAFLVFVLSFVGCGTSKPNINAELDKVMTKEAFNAQSDKCLKYATTGEQVNKCMDEEFSPKLKKLCSDSKLSSQDCLSLQAALSERQLSYTKEKQEEERKLTEAFQKVQKRAEQMTR